TAITRPLITEPSMPLVPPKDSSRSAAKSSLPATPAAALALAIRIQFLSHIFPASRLSPAVCRQIRASIPGAAPPRAGKPGRQDGWASHSAGSAGLAGDRRLATTRVDQGNRRGEGGVGIESGAVDDRGVGGRDHGRCRPAAVAGVPVLHILQNAGIYSLVAPCEQLLVAAPRPFLWAGGDEYLNVRPRADHGADVPPVQHRPGGGA